VKSGGRGPRAGTQGGPLKCVLRRQNKIQAGKVFSRSTSQECCQRLGGSSRAGWKKLRPSGMRTRVFNLCWKCTCQAYLMSSHLICKRGVGAGITIHQGFGSTKEVTEHESTWPRGLEHSSHLVDIFVISAACL
jgi:hypothetical protein